jgi:hypothetical protein
MRQTMSLKSRRELIASIAPRYKQAANKEKKTILDEFIAATGYHRQYAISLLNSFDPNKWSLSKPKRRSRRRKYTTEVQTALVTAWEAAHCICSKRLVPFLPQMVDSLERHGHLNLSADVRAKLLSISSSTVDRLLYEIRQGSLPSGIGTTKPGSLIKHLVPIRTFADWDDCRPGFIEADLVAHCGDNVGGSFLNTLTMTDVSTGWTECLALLYRGKETTLRALRIGRGRLPFPLLGLDTDNGSEFLNYLLLEYCEDETITFTRSRAYKKNDQCHVEQKNGAVVRNFVGYDRFEGIEPCRILDEMYLHLRLYVNFFQPSVKLVSKKREGSRVTKIYDKAQTPCQRVLADETILKDTKRHLRDQFESLDPVALLHEIERLQDMLWQHAHVKTEVIKVLVPLNGSGLIDVQMKQSLLDERVGQDDTTLPTQMAVLPTIDGSDDPVVVVTEMVPKRSKRRYRRTKRKHGNCYVERWWRTRKDPFSDVWEEVRQQLEQTPYIQATALYASLQAKYPWKFTDGQLRTFQRRVQAWRLEQVSAHLERNEDLGQETIEGDHLLE